MTDKRHDRSDEQTAWPGSDGSRRTIAAAGQFTRDATRTGLSVVDLQLEFQRAGAAVPKLALESYLRATELFLPATAPSGEAGGSRPSEPLEHPPEPSPRAPVERAQPVRPPPAEPPVRTPGHEQPIGDRLPPTPVDSPPDPQRPAAPATATRSYPAPSQPGDSDGQTSVANRRLESPLAGAAVAAEIETVESTTPASSSNRHARGQSPDRGTDSGRSDDSGFGDRGPRSQEDRPGGETPLLGADAKTDREGQATAEDWDAADPDREEIADGSNRAAPGRENPTSEAEPAQENSHGSASTAAETADETHPGRHVDEPESALEERASNETPTVEQRDDRTKERRDERESVDDRVDEQPGTQRADTEAGADQQPTAGEHGADERTGEHGADERTGEHGADEQREATEDTVPDESSSLFSRIFRRL